MRLAEVFRAPASSGRSLPGLWDSNEGPGRLTASPMVMKATTIVQLFVGHYTRRMKATELWKQTLLVAALVATAGVVSGCKTAQTSASTPLTHSTLSTPQTKASQAAMTPAGALERLKEGNRRFVSGRT